LHTQHAYYIDYKTAIGTDFKFKSVRWQPENLQYHKFVRNSKAVVLIAFQTKLANGHDTMLSNCAIRNSFSPKAAYLLLIKLKLLNNLSGRCVQRRSGARRPVASRPYGPVGPWPDLKLSQVGPCRPMARSGPTWQGPRKLYF
jgi:hypothetical protein